MDVDQPRVRQSSVCCPRAQVGLRQAIAMEETFGQWTTRSADCPHWSTAGLDRHALAGSYQS